MAGGVVFLVWALTACSLGSWNGQSAESADAALLAIPGVSKAAVTTDSLRSGLQVEISTAVEVTLEDGFSVPDPEAFVDYLLHVAWSTEAKEPNRAVIVQVRSEPQIAVIDALDAGGWDSARGRSSNPHRALVRANEVKDRLGDWPGEVPELPDGLIVGPTADPGS
jgi:hypothetical protein